MAAHYILRAYVLCSLACSTCIFHEKIFVFYKKNISSDIQFRENNIKFTRRCGDSNHLNVSLKGSDKST